MRKIIYIVCAILLITVSNTVNAQLTVENDVTITMDLQPVLQLDMSTPDQINFIFDEINEYSSGIIKYGATQLRVSSTVSWDLYVVGRSAGMNTSDSWDQQIEYGRGGHAYAVDNLPLSALEIRQSQADHSKSSITDLGSLDYSSQFPIVSSPSGTNSLYYDGSNTNTPPGPGQRYIAGGSGTGVGRSIDGGSYLTSKGTTSDYHYSIDYRIVPGLPAVFPMAHNSDGGSEALTGEQYVQPGVYTMYVQYILLADQ